MSIKKLVFLIVATVLLGTLLALTPGSASAAEHVWRGEYYNNRSLAGLPVLLRHDNSIDFNWGDGSPAAGVVANDNFSVRWTRDVSFNAGRYRFTTRTDDGVRLWVNNQLIIDQWKDQEATSHSAEITLPAGSIPIRMEYYDRTGGAVARLSWTQVQGATTQTWRGEYFNNTSLSGSPAVVRDDSSINFNWGRSGPVLGVRRDDFSVRWTRTVNMQPGRYRFTTRTDDGVRLWVNNQLIIDRWVVQPLRSHSVEVTLPGGATPIRMEYFERSGLAEAHLSWGLLSGATPGVPSPGTAVMNGAYFLNVRSGPGLNHRAIATVERGAVLNLLGYRNAAGNWIMVSLPNGTQGWVHAGYVQTSVPVSSMTVWTQDGGTVDRPGQVTATVNTG
ncbi:MAG TPA: PA14 domain-containing protein, partial [Candidatus Sulfomarinibacteraceae bacterium]|nr:PA14 domain-containing protein [Candidatus Sulfomarinibacteraceae bacterium]